MSEDLDSIRRETAAKLKAAVAQAEDMQFRGVRMVNLRFLLNRTSFTIKKGFQTNPGKVKITVFGDSELIYSDTAIVKGTELVYHISKKYKNLPLKEYSRLAIMVTPECEEVDSLNPFNLYLINGEGYNFHPVDYSRYMLWNIKVD